MTWLETRDVNDWLRDACGVPLDNCTEVVIRVPIDGPVTITAVHLATEKLIAGPMPIRDASQPSPPLSPENETTTRGPRPPDAPSSPHA